MNNIYGSQQEQRQPSQYPMFEEFLQTIVPAIESSKSRERRFGREEFSRKKRAEEDMFELQAREGEKNRMFQEKGRLNQIAAQSAGQQQPMGTKYQPFISPLDEARLGLQAEKNDITQQLGLARIAAQLENTGQRVDLGREQIGSREKIAEGRVRSAEQIAANKDALQRELTALRGDQTMAGINRRGQIAQELQALEGEQRLQQIEATGEQQRQTQAEKPIKPEKPESAGQEKTRMQISMNRFLNQEPEYREYVELVDGMPQIAEDTPEDVKNYIMRKLNMSPSRKGDITLPSETKTETEKPPEGMKSGGKWVNTKRGRVYVEP